MEINVTVVASADGVVVTVVLMEDVVLDTIIVVASSERLSSCEKNPPIKDLYLGSKRKYYASMLLPTIPPVVPPTTTKVRTAVAKAL